jgi:uncharacterized protein YndB with AHSA1/START domain
MAKNNMHVTVTPGTQDIIMSRVFDAPRELVFKTYTDPALIPQWWGPRGITTIVDKMEVKTGGIWRYIQRGADGSEYAFSGVYHESLAPERLVYTFEFEPMPGHVCLETVKFEDQEGKTKVTVISVFQSVEDRDGMVQSGMEEGAVETWDRLAELLAKS